MLTVRHCLPAMIPLLATLLLVASPGAGHAALSQNAAEFLIRDCIARFGHERVRACEAVAASATRPGVNPTEAACRAVAQRRDIKPEVAPQAVRLLLPGQVSRPARERDSRPAKPGRMVRRLSRSVGGHAWHISQVPPSGR
jgi:hypothetical protein